MKIKMKMKHWSSRYDINRPRPRHGHIFSKYKKCLGMMILFVLSNTWATFEAQFMKNLSNTEARMKKSVAYLRWTLSLRQSLATEDPLKIMKNAFSI